MTGTRIATVVVALYASWALPAPTEAQDRWAEAIAEFETRLESDVAADGVGGITAGVFLGEDVLWVRGFGLADRSGAPAGPRSIYRIGSVSKSVTAMAMMTLVQDGVLALDDPVSDHLPEIEGLGSPPAPGPPLTLRRLASHTGGLIREPRLADAASGPLAVWEAKILASIEATTFASPVGVQYLYSNIGYGILGLAISRAAGRPFLDLVEERVFQPLGMRSTTFVIDDRLRNRLATGYLNENGAIDASVPAREHAGRGYKVPNGGVYSTVADLARFANAMTDASNLLTPETRAEMLTAQTPEDSPSTYGIGFRLWTDEDGTRWAGHGGHVAGYRVYLAFQPDTGLGVAILRNYDDGLTTLSEAARTFGTALHRALQ